MRNKYILYNAQSSDYKLFVNIEEMILKVKTRTKNLKIASMIFED